MVSLVMVCSLPEPSGPRCCDPLSARYFVSALGISFIVLFCLQVLFTLSFITARGHDCQMLAFGAFCVCVVLPRFPLGGVPACLRHWSSHILWSTYIYMSVCTPLLFLWAPTSATLCDWWHCKIFKVALGLKCGKQYKEKQIYLWNGGLIVA